MNSEVPPPPIPRPEHNYVNDIVMSEVRDRANATQPRDIFDMRKLSCHTLNYMLPYLGFPYKSNFILLFICVAEPFNTAVESASARVTYQRGQLQSEVWFHGFVSRQDAEALLTRVCYFCNFYSKSILCLSYI